MDSNTSRSETINKKTSSVNDGKSESMSTHIFVDDDDDYSTANRKSDTRIVTSCRRHSQRTCKHRNFEFGPARVVGTAEIIRPSPASPPHFPTQSSLTPTPSQTKREAPSDRLPLSQAVQIVNGNAAHLFLSYSYAGKPGTTTTKMKTKPTIDTRGQGHRRVSSWGSSLDDFELECDLFLQTNQKLSQGRASSISKALKKVAQEAVDSDSSVGDVECRNSRFASYLRAALAREKENAETPCNLFHHDGNPAKDEEESLREKLKRQNEEIQFLRSTVKVLVHSGSAERRDPNPCHREGLQSEVVETNIKTLTETLADIPHSIDVRRLAPVVDDITIDRDEMSDVTPSEGGTNLPRDGIPGFIAHPKAVPGTPQHQSSPVRIFDFDISSSRIKTPKSPAAAITTYGVPGKLHQAELVSFPDMAKGEIQDKRARGLLCNVYFQSWGILLQGRYIGTLRDGQPNGNGVLRFHNRDCYIGTFKDGMLHGEGALFLRRNGCLLKFRGQFERNEFIGWRWVKPTTTTPPIGNTGGTSFKHQALITH